MSPNIEPNGCFSSSIFGDSIICQLSICQPHDCLLLDYEIMNESNEGTKIEIFKYLKESTGNISPESLDAFTTTVIADQLHVSRSLTSQYLNELVEEGRILKIKSRPVYFFDRERLEKKYSVKLNSVEFFDVDEMFDYIRLHQKLNSPFEEMVGCEGSLKRVIKQACELFDYPPNGLPFVIYGNDGTGKKTLADLICKNSRIQGGIVNKSTKIIRRDAYQDSSVLVKQLNDAVNEYISNGLIIILSHLENIDQNLEEFIQQHISKETERNLHFIFLSNKVPNTYLNSALAKSIPLYVNLSDYDKRPKEEREGIVVSLFKKEAAKLDASIQISSNVLKSLSNARYSDNIQGLVTTVRLICVRASAKADNDVITVHTYDMPVNELESVQPTTEDVAYVDCSKYQPSNEIDLYIDFFNSVMESCKEKNAAAITARFSPIYNAIEDHILVSGSDSSRTLQGIEVAIANIVNAIIQRRFITIPGNFSFLLAHLFYIYQEYKTKFDVWADQKNDELNGMLEKIQKLFVSEYMITEEIDSLMQNSLELPMPSILKVIVSLIFYRYNGELRKRNIYGVIICHGYSTASSIANAVNSLIGSYVFDAIDMPVSTSVEDIKNMLKDRLLRINRFADAVILVDMGSLEDIAPEIVKESSRNIAIMNNVSTKMALNIGYRIKNGVSISDIFENCESDYQIEHTVIYGKETDMILFVSEGGLPTAQRMADLFRDSLPEDIPVQLVIAPYDKIRNGDLSAIQENRSLLFITGTEDPHLEEVTFIPLEDIITTGNLDIVAHKLSGYLDENGMKELGVNIRRNFTLINVVNYLTILNPKPLLDYVTAAVDGLQQKMNIELQGKCLIGIYIHVCVLIERLVTKSGVIKDDEVNQKFAQEHPDFIQDVKACFKPVLDHYSIEIPDAEMMYFHNYINEESQKN
jgi:sigma-54 dependent transcriptional regulator of gfr operon